MFATSYSKLQMECMTHEEENELTAVSGGSGVVKRLFIDLFKKQCWLNNDIDLSTWKINTF